MKIGIAIFAYNRAEHLKKVLEGLKRNEIIGKVYIFQDGLKCESDRRLWEITTKLINEIDWCEKEVLLSKENKGLSQSIIKGIKYVLEENDAIIILEDDCVPRPAFISYMRQCFIKYENYKEVFSISGYSWPIKTGNHEGDNYFCQRPCSWGWGTWKDRWELYTQDANLIRDIKKNKIQSRELAIWGDDLENMLVSNYRGYNDSWYVYWALFMIQQKLYAVNPYISLIENIGFDGTGVHCCETNKFNVYKLDNRKKGTVFCLKDSIIVEEQIKKEFIELYGNYGGMPQNLSNPVILVYGIGRFYKRNAKKIWEKFAIDAFVDRWRKDPYYAGIEVIHPRQIGERNFDYILIMIEDTKVMLEAKDYLINDIQVDPKKILLGNKDIF